MVSYPQLSLLDAIPGDAPETGSPATVYDKPNVDHGHLLADAVIAVIREVNEDIRPALRDALASWENEGLTLDQTFELHEKGCVCDDCLPDDID